MWIQRLFSVFSSSATQSSERLTRADVELISMVRMNPSTPLQGADFNAAKGLVSRGLLKPAGTRRFVVTEKAVAACRQPRI